MILIGAWFSYGQQPTAFLESWRKVVSAIRAASQRENIAFIWAPNSGNGYPFPSIEYSAAPGTLHWDPVRVFQIESFSLPFYAIS